jgi:hypothetical protein
MFFAYGSQCRRGDAKAGAILLNGEFRLSSIARSGTPRLLPKRDSCEAALWYPLCRSSWTVRATSRLTRSRGSCRLVRGGTTE